MMQKDNYEEIRRDSRDLENEIEEYKKAEFEKQEREDKYQHLIENAPIGIVTVSSSGAIESVNPFFCNLLGYAQKELLQLCIEEITHPDDMEMETLKIKEMLKNNLSRVKFEKRYIKKNGEPIWAELVTSSLWNQKAEASFGLGMVVDITERKQAEMQREKLISELQNALSEIKTLKGILPICSYCKKIRNDKGYWDQIEAYIKNHTEAEFSHGICQDCAKKYYPDMDLYDEDEA